MAEREHLLARENDTHRALERLRRHHGEKQLVLRPQTRAERAADVRRDHAHVVLVEAEDLAHVIARVHDALRLVVNRDPAGAFPHHGRRVHFHRVVVLEGMAVFGFVPHRRRLR